VEKNNKLWLGILIGVLASLVIGLVGYIVYDKVLSKDVDEVVDTKDDFNNNDNEIQQEQEIIIDLSLDNSTVKNLSDKVIGVYTNNEMADYIDYFYKKDRILLNEQDISFKLSLALETLTDLFDFNSDGYDCNTGICGISYISEEIVKDAYFDLFGNDAHYERALFTNSNSNCSGSEGYVWSDENNRYESVSYGGCGGFVFGGTISKLGYAKQITSSNLDRIELYEYFAYEAPSVDSDVVRYYSDYNRTNLIISTTDRYSNDVFFNEFVDDVGIYKYTFEKDKYGTYVFTSVEKVK